MAQPQKDKNKKKDENGLKCEKPSCSQSETKTNQVETKLKPNVTKAEPKSKKMKPNVNDNDNVNVNDIKEKESTKKNRFVPPTLEQVQDYCKEQSYSNVDAQRFIDFYESKGWFVGKNKMKDWKAAVRNWNRSQRSDLQPKQNTKPSFNSFKHTDYDLDALDKELIG